MSNPDSNKPREFWIQDTAAEVYSATEVSCYDEKVNPSIIDEWHVVEHSAYEAQAKEIEELKAELNRLKQIVYKASAGVAYEQPHETAKYLQAAHEEILATKITALEAELAQYRSGK